jgi:ribulose 1,5-bisphosphate synthetase/thiazole synthase
MASQIPSERLSAVASHLNAGEDNTHAAEATYDYVIIGGGTAGCVIADRLSQDSGVNVAVIEGGPSDERDERYVSHL